MNKYRRALRLEFFNVVGDSVEQLIDPVTDLRVAFDVDKTDGTQMNHATITVFNMSPSDRALIARPMPLSFDWRYAVLEPVVLVRLYAGYDDNPVHLYSGDILWAHTTKVGPDWITQMECYTGLTETTRPAQVSFSKQTSARTVLEALVAPLGITLRYTDAAATILEGKTVDDFTSSGLAYREAEQFARRYDLSFTMEDDGQGLVYDPRSSRDPNQAKGAGNTFSPETGLVGAPKVTRAGIELRSLLRPDFSLLQRFFVESATTRSTLQGSPDYAPEYYVSHIKHTGDIRGEDWYTDIEGFYARLDQ